ncbi:MAG: hypothetical protein F6K47_28305 [Symploca sp. SIO2E6]|nr:hypothetical protein [Symploca sp. SIO2E6]
MEALSMLDEIVQELERQENFTRIKKLLFYACKNYWENDLSIINSCNLQDFLRQLRSTNPTIEQLRFTLERLVETINRKAEYSLVANTILSRVGKLYSNGEGSTEVILVRPHNLYDSAPQTSIVNEIASELEQNPNSVRIKKLMLYMCRNVWENNTQILDGLAFKDLLPELRESYSTLELLNSNLYSTVATLNRPTEYALIAYTIINKVEKLYPDDEEPTAAHSAKIAKSSPAVQQAAKISSAASPQTLKSSPPVGQTTQPLSQQDQSTPSYDPFELRLAIMRYTNPLRAKILLFSALYQQFNPREQDWSEMKNKELDELLFSMFSQCSTINELEFHLHETAKCLEEPDEGAQAAAAIIKSMKSLYKNY